MPTRVTDEQVNDKRSQIAKREAQIERWERFSKGKKSDLWKELGPIITKAKESCEKSALRHLRGGVKDDITKSYLAAGEALGYERILADVDESDGKIEKAREEISLLRQAIAAAKKNRGII